MSRYYLKQFQSHIDSENLVEAENIAQQVKKIAHLSSAEKECLLVEFQIIRCKKQESGKTFTRKDIENLRKTLNQINQNDFFDDEPTGVSAVFDELSPQRPERSGLPDLPENISVTPHLKWSDIQDDSDFSVQDARSFCLDDVRERLLAELKNLEIELINALDNRRSIARMSSSNIEISAKINLKITNACVLLRDEYYHFSYAKNKVEQLKIEEKILQIKKEFAEKICALGAKRTQETELTEIEFSLVVLENELSKQDVKEQKLKACQQKLMSFQQNKSIRESALPFVKWEVAKLKAQNMLDDLSQPFKKITNEEIKINNLLKKVKSELRKIEKRKIVPNILKKDGFSLLYDVFEPKKIDLDSFLEALLLFSLEEKDFIESLNIMKLYFQGLTTNELKELNHKMQSKEVISLATAFYAQQLVAANMGFLPDKESQSALSVINEESDEWVALKNEIQKKQCEEKQKTKTISVEEAQKLKLYSQLSPENAEELCEKILKPATESEMKKFLERLKMIFMDQPDCIREIKNDLQVKLPQALDSTEIDSYARQKFFETGASIYSMISNYYIALNRELKERKKNVAHGETQRASFSQKYNGLDFIRFDSEKTICFPFSEDIASEWPSDNEGEPLNIQISEKEKILIQKSVISLISDSSALKIRQERRFLTAVPESIRERESMSQRKQAHYFAKMMGSLGTFFNPNKFIDALSAFDENPHYIAQTISQMSLDELNALYQNFQGQDLNDLVLLLRCAKVAHAEEMRDVCGWLSVERHNFPVFNENFQAMAGKLYDSANEVMQAVRTEIIARNEVERISGSSYVSLNEAQAMENFELNDYSYNSLELAEERIYTKKNAACIRRTLDMYYPSKPEYKVTLSLWDSICDSVYGFLYPSKKEKLLYKAVNEDVDPTISSDDGMDELVRDRAESFRDSFDEIMNTARA